MRRPVTLRPGPDGSYRFDEGELRAAFGPRTRLVLLNSPHNPTGKVFTRAELTLIASLCQEHDVYAVTDASGGVSSEAHDMAIRRVVAAGAQPITWLAMAGELQRDWARTERLGAVAQILFDHAGASGTVLAWELANEAQHA